MAIFQILCNVAMLCKCVLNLIFYFTGYRDPNSTFDVPVLKSTISLTAERFIARIDVFCNTNFYHCTLF